MILVVYAPAPGASARVLATTGTDQHSQRLDQFLPEGLAVDTLVFQGLVESFSCSLFQVYGFDVVQQQVLGYKLLGLVGGKSWFSKCLY